MTQQILDRPIDLSGESVSEEPKQRVQRARVTDQRNWLRPKYLLFAFIGLMYAYVFWNNESFLANSKSPEWSHIASFKWWLLPHGLAAGCALLLGPLQFSDRLRKRFAKLHRVLGRLYVAGVFIGAPIGIYIQYFEERLGAPRSLTIAAAADAAVWIFTTAMGLIFILQGKVQQHRQWMTRSFAAALIFLEVRTIIDLTGWVKFVETIIWCCVAAAVPIADFVLQWQETRRARPVQSKRFRFAAQKS
jgi:uncharacterized membrane protein